MRALAAGVLVSILASGGAVSRHRPLDPATAPKAFVDRFSKAAGHLQVRTAENPLPAPNAPVNFDREPFVTRGFGPHGEHVTYYNFDVQPLKPAPEYVLCHQRESTPVNGQLPIIDALPGEPGYSDFHVVVRVTVPATYTANSITSAAALRAAGYPMERTTSIVNTPVVPDGSTARLRLGGPPATLGTAWVNDRTVRYFTFIDRPLTGTVVPVSPIFVTFNRNPGTPGGGPASGFKTEKGTRQTHNVLATLPADPGYSPLWQVSIYDNAAFAGVHDLATLRQAKVLASNVAFVNCPVVTEQGMFR